MKPYYEDEWSTIYHGDCREVTAWLEADVLVTDPPYGIGWSKGNNTRRLSRKHAGIVGDDDTSVRDAVLAVWLPRPGVVFGSFYAPRPAGVAQVLAWRKPAMSGVVGSTTGYRRDVEPVFLVGDWPRRPCEWSSALVSGGNIAGVVAETGHPHTKPLDVMRLLIGRCPDGVIVDPFMGSGSTLRAAKDLGRKAIGVEVDERYCEIAASRLGQEVLAL